MKSYLSEVNVGGEDGGADESTVELGHHFDFFKVWFFS